MRRADLISAVCNVANWRAIFAGQSYFAGFDGASPVRHFWSLAIEEQFYLVWPAACALLLGRVTRRTFGVVCLGLAVASATACAVLYTATDPSRAYYGTDTRAHQLLLGAAAAVLLSRQRDVGRTVTVPAWATIGSGAALLIGFARLADDSAL